MKIYRSAIHHAPEPDRLISFEDGGLAVEGGKVVVCDDYSVVRARFPESEVADMRDGCIIPGLVDAHIHFPQVRIMGHLGDSLLDWLDNFTLPEEARMADTAYARVIANEFIQALAAHGTTTALVFGAHFADATAALFDCAAAKGLRIISGLVLSDRFFRPELLQTPDRAYRDSERLIRSIRGSSRLGYAVIPRFALSTTEQMLEVCRTVLREHPSALFTTHINENEAEIAEVAKQFPAATDYLDVYEQSGLISDRAVLAHNVHTADSQLARLAKARAAIVHCPCSNAALGSGIFPMARHLRHGVRFALGTDVGAGTGFSVLREALQAHLFQRVAPEPVNISPERMLWLATKAGAQVLKLSDTIGDFAAGKAADFVWGRRLRLATLFLQPVIDQVYVEGALVHDNGGSESRRS